MRRLVVAVVLALVAGTAAASAQGPAFPKRIALPDGFQPEGISIAGNQFYVGSIPTGAIYRGSLRTGQGSILVPGAAGRAAIGVETDRGRLFVAGGPTGKAFVYDARTGRLLAERMLATGAGTFVNDVVVTRRAAWFTDSFRPVLYRLPLGPGGRPGGQAAVQTLALSGDYQHQPGFNLNGIEATANGATLVVVQSSTATLFAVDPRSGRTRTIGLGAASVSNGDGLVLRGRTLYVVQNQLNQIARITLAPNLRSGRVVRTITDPLLDVPTTADLNGSRLYAVNARFGNPSPASAEYWVTRVLPR
jgi:sugar lactone lactonase YvrE